MTRGPKSWAARAALHYLWLWDVAASNRVDAFIANSAYVARRINKLYRREARVVHPPVDVERSAPDGPDLPREGFYLTVSRFVPYKRVDLLARAFSGTGRELVVIGNGPDLDRGRQPDGVVADHLRRARAFVDAADEDFGITPLEAQAAGCPVIAYGRGGALKTVAG